MEDRGRSRPPVPWHLHRRMVEVARSFRKEPTRSEHLFWRALRGGGIEGCRFRRHQPIGPFVVDFFCPRQGLIVEVDGPIHDREQDRDRERQLLLEACGYRVLRIPAETVVSDLAGALASILSALVDRRG